MQELLRLSLNLLVELLVGAKMRLKSAATIPAAGSQINISSSKPQTLLEAAPPITAAVYTPMPINDPWANVICPANPETIFIPQAPIEKVSDLDISKIQ